MEARLASAQQQAAALKAAVDTDAAKAKSLLGTLKIALTEFPALPPMCQPSPTAQKELTIARDVLECGVLLSVKLRDEAAFERNYLQLKPFYTDVRSQLPPSPQEHLMTGLNLLRLLVQNRIAEFHMELELIPADTQKVPLIRHPIELEACLMEGNASKLLGAAARGVMPSETYAYFMEQLMRTVKEEVVSCAEKAYTSLSTTHAKEVLLLPSDVALSELVAARGWELRDGAVWFQARERPEPNAAKDIPSMQVISQALGYAKELERIV